MEMQPVLEGDRLRLRPLAPEDREALFAVAGDRQIWANHPAHDRWQDPVFRRFFDDALDRGGALVIIERASGTVIGSSQFIPTDDPDAIEIGYSFLAHRLWGGGWNAEFKRLMLAHALEHYPRVVFKVGKDNVVSRKAMANIGGVLTARTSMSSPGGVPVEHVIFEITREGFANGPLAV